MKFVDDNDDDDDDDDAEPHYHITGVKRLCTRGTEANGIIMIKEEASDSNKR